MTKTLTNLLNSIIKGKHHLAYGIGQEVNPSIATQLGFILSDGVFYIEMLTDNISGDLIINNTDKHTEKLQSIADIVAGYMENPVTEITLPSINQLKAWRKSDYCDNQNKKPFLIEFINKFGNQKDYIGFNISCLIDFITITKAKKAYICKNSDGYVNSLCPIYFSSDNLNILLMPMRYQQEYINSFKKSLENL